MKRHHKLALSVFTLTVIGVALVLAKALQADAADATGERMAEAANKLLSGLSDELRAKTTFTFDDPVRLSWHFYPVTPEPRKGAVLKAMTAKEKELVKDLLRAGTSKEGYDQALNVIALENILRDIENTEWAKKFRDSDLYYVSVFGKPAKTGKWGWRIEGHHLSLNYVIDDGKVIASTPIAFGANPGEVMSGPHKGLRALMKEEDLARQLYTSLEPASRKKATISAKAPFDILTEMNVQPRRLPAEGLARASMDSRQQQVLDQLVKLYANRHPADVSTRLQKEIAEAGADKVVFGWAGPPEPGQPHYYRIQGPTFVIEYCNAQNRANHIHSLWRSYLGDFALTAKP